MKHYGIPEHTKVWKETEKQAKKTQQNGWKKKTHYNYKSVWEDQQQTRGTASLEIYVKGKHTWLQKMR